MKTIFTCIVIMLMCLVLNAEVYKEIQALKDTILVKVDQYSLTDENVAVAYLNLSKLYCKNFMHYHAVKTAENALNMYKEIFGERHAKTANAYNYLAEIYAAMGEHSKAINLWQKALESNPKISEGEEEDIYNYIGKFYELKGDYKNAQLYYNKTLKSSVALFKIDNSIIGHRYMDIGIIYEKNKEFIKAMLYYEEALEIYKHVLGREHQHTANALNRIGKMCNAIGSYNKSIKFHKKAMRIYKKIIGEENDSTSTLYNNLGDVYIALGDYSKAARHYKKALKINLKLSREEHPSTATSYYNIGVLNQATGDYPKAISHFNKALTIRFEVLDKNHPDVATIYNQLGHVFYKMGFAKKAIHNYNKALLIYTKKRRRKLSSIYQDLGNVYLSLGDHKKALKFHNEALDLCKKIFGETHPNVGDVYINLGKVYENFGDYSTTTKYYEKALQTYFLSETYKKHYKTAIAHTSLGNIFRNAKDYEKSLHWHQKALEMMEDLSLHRHPGIASVYNNMGLVYRDLDKNLKAIKYHEKALKIYLKVYEETHSHIATTYSQLGSLYNKIQDYTGAVNYYHKALDVRLKVQGKKHIATIQEQANLAIAFEQSEQYSTAYSLWNIIIPNLENQLNENYLFLPDDKKIFYLNTIDHIFKNFYCFMGNKGIEQTKLLSANLLINTKSQILDYANSTRRLITKTNNEYLDSIAFQLNVVNQKVAKAELLTKEELQQKGWDLDALRLLKDDLASIILLHPELKVKLNLVKISWQQIQEKLKVDEVLIDYLTFLNRADSTWIFQAMLIKKDEPQPVFIPLTSVKPVNELLKTKDNLPLYIQYKKARQEMYGYVWQALEPHLKDIKTIHLSPVENEEGQYLAGLYDFHYYSSSKDFYKQTENQPNYADATLYGHIAYFKDHQAQYELEEDTLRLQRDTLRPLPATLHEVNAIESICTPCSLLMLPKKIRLPIFRVIVRRALYTSLRMELTCRLSTKKKKKRK